MNVYDEDPMVSFSAVSHEASIQVVVESISATMTFRSISDPCGTACCGVDGDAERLVVLGDVRTRETRIVPRHLVQEEVASAVIARLWRGL